MRPAQGTRYRAAASAVFLVYLVWLLSITVFRPGFSFAELGQHGVIAQKPFAEYYWWWKRGEYRPFIYLFFGNIGVFLPFGGFLAWRRPGWQVLAVTQLGTMFSFAIETGQYLLGTGVSDASDLVLNSLGVFLGAAAVRLVQRLHRSTPSRKQP